MCIRDSLYALRGWMASRLYREMDWTLLDDSAPEAIPENWRNYRTAYALARALENYAMIGDHDEGTLKSKGDKALLRAIEVLESVREEAKRGP